MTAAQREQVASRLWPAGSASPRGVWAVLGDELVHVRSVVSVVHRVNGRGRQWLVNAFHPYPG